MRAWLLQSCLAAPWLYKGPRPCAAQRPHARRRRRLRRVRVARVVQRAGRRRAAVVRRAQRADRVRGRAVGVARARARRVGPVALEPLSGLPAEARQRAPQARTARAGSRTGMACTRVAVADVGAQEAGVACWTERSAWDHAVQPNRHHGPIEQRKASTGGAIGTQVHNSADMMAQRSAPYARPRCRAPRCGRASSCARAPGAPGRPRRRPRR